jgi:O-acetyl-ADP-ribose deacetylase (regulator of RNase III)
MAKKLLRVVLVDINEEIVEAWQNVFGHEPGVAIVHGSMLDQEVDAWVTPTNARGSMDGGLDAVIAGHIKGIAKKVKTAITKEYSGFMPVGAATCVETGLDSPRFLISVPTMVGSSDDVSETSNAALACAAAFQAVHLQNRQESGSILSVAMSGLGSNTGQLPPDACAGLMWAGYRLFREYRFRDFASLRAALMGQLADLVPLFAQERRQYNLPDLEEMEPEERPYTRTAEDED